MQLNGANSTTIKICKQKPYGVILLCIDITYGGIT